MYIRYGPILSINMPVLKNVNRLRFISRYLPHPQYGWQSGSCGLLLSTHHLLYSALCRSPHREKNILISLVGQTNKIWCALVERDIKRLKGKLRESEAGLEPLQAASWLNSGRAHVEWLAVGITTSGCRPRMERTSLSVLLWHFMSFPVHVGVILLFPCHRYFTRACFKFTS